MKRSTWARASFEERVPIRRVRSVEVGVESGWEISEGSGSDDIF